MLFQHLHCPYNFNLQIYYKSLCMCLSNMFTWLTVYYLLIAYSDTWNKNMDMNKERCRHLMHSRVEVSVNY
jgi:hypothetical protein